MPKRPKSERRLNAEKHEKAENDRRDAQHDKKVENLVNSAMDQEGSTAYTPWNGTAGGSEWRGKWKCNLFVFDMLNDAGLPAPLYDPGWWRPSRPPSAEEWGDPSKEIPGYPVVEGEPIPGDIAAGNGHVGIVTEGPGPDGKGGKTVSAAPDKVTHNDWGFDDKNPARKVKTFRRPTRP